MPLRKLAILVVDDDARMLRMMQRMDELQSELEQAREDLASIRRG